MEKDVDQRSKGMKPTWQWGWVFWVGGRTCHPVESLDFSTLPGLDRTTTSSADYVRTCQGSLRHARSGAAPYNDNISCEGPERPQLAESKASRGESKQTRPSNSSGSIKLTQENNFGRHFVVVHEANKDKDESGIHSKLELLVLATATATGNKKLEKTKRGFTLSYYYRKNKCATYLFL